MIRNAPTLKEATFNHVHISDLEDLRRCSPFLQDGRSKLRKLVLQDVGVAAQAFLLDMLDLPTSKLIVDARLPRGTNEQWEEILHPAVASRLGHIKFTCLRFSDCTILLSEHNVQNTTRCNLSLRVDCVRDAASLLKEDTSMFDLSQVVALEVIGSANGTYPVMGLTGLSSGLVNSVTSLKLVGVWFDSHLFLGLRSLRKLRVEEPDYAPEGSQHPRMLIYWLLVRHDPPNVGNLHPVESVVLRYNPNRLDWICDEEVELLKRVKGMEIVADETVRPASARLLSS